MKSTSARRRATRVGLSVGAVAATALGLAAPASAAASAEVANGTLTVRGSGSDQIALRLALGAPTILEVDLDDDGSAEASFDRSTFTRIDVLLGGGSDQFRVDQVNGSFADEALTVDGGSGSDSMSGGDGAETFIGGSGSDFADGNRGDDTGIMGSGNDTFRWDPGDGSDVVEGQSGFDTLDFNGAGANEVMSLSANGSRSLFLRDVANIRMDMDGVERLDLTALGGIDRVTVDDLTGTDIRVADVDLSGPAGGGDGQPDLVTVNGTQSADDVEVDEQSGRVVVAGLQAETRIAGAEAADILQVNTLGGDDTVDVDPVAAALLQVLVDLGADA